MAKTAALRVHDGRLWRAPIELTVVRGADKGRKVVVHAVGCSLGSDPGCDLALADEAVSSRHAEIELGERGALLVDQGSTNGSWLGDRRVERAFLAPKDEIRVGRTVIRVALLTPEEVAVGEGGRWGELIGASLPMRELFAQLDRIAASDSPVMLEGESGTGKDVAARALHARSRRAEAAFVVFDCAAANPELLEATLFGWRRGAFSGAHDDRAGLFEEADGGALYLDGLDELPLALQAKLLRALDQGEVRRLGAGEATRVDVRPIAATRRRLAAEVERGAFREDLFHRLQILHATLPPLRHRDGDVPLLARHFLAELGDGRLLGEEALAALAAYRWPGNVRELRNALLRGLAFATSPELAPRHLQLPKGSAVPSRSALPFYEARQRVIDDFERRALDGLLEEHRGNVTQAARAAGVPRQSFHKLLARHGLRRGPG